MSDKPVYKLLWAARNEMMISQDFDKVLKILDEGLKSKEIDTTDDDYFNILSQKIMALKKKQKENQEEPDEYLLKEKRVHEEILDNPYSYLRPHQRIDSRFAIKHIDLELDGIPWSKKHVEGGEEDA